MTFFKVCSQNQQVQYNEESIKKIYAEESFEIQWTVKWLFLDQLFTKKETFFGIIQSIAQVPDELLEKRLKPLLKGSSIESIRPGNGGCPSDYPSLCYN